MSGEGVSACRATKNQILVALAAAVVILAAALVGRGYPKGSGMRLALAIVETLATAVCLIVPAWSVGHLDELQRKIQLEALALAFIGTGILGAGYGFLLDAGVMPGDWGGFIWPAMVGLWAIGYVVASRRYR